MFTTLSFQWGKEKTWFIPGFSVSILLIYHWSGPAVRVQTTRVNTFTVFMHFSHPVQMKETQVCTVFISGSTKNTRSTRRSTTALLRPRSLSLSWCLALRHSCDSRSNLEDRLWAPRGETVFCRISVTCWTFCHSLTLCQRSDLHRTSWSCLPSLSLADYS